MLISQLGTNPQFYFAWVISIILSIVLHELGHGVAAIKLGDRTPIEMGHMTLNPLTHMGPLSILLACTIGIAWGAMPVNTSRLRGKYADAIVSVAGPAVNVVLALLCMTAIVIWIKIAGRPVESNYVASNILTLLTTMSFLNIALVLLNLIPVPPLDGSRILANFSRPYARLLENPTMQGILLAVTFGVLIAGGRFIVPIANDIMMAYLGLWF